MIWFRLISLVLMVSAVGGLFLHYNYTIKENKRLRGQIELANKTITAMDNINRRHNEIREETDSLIAVIDNEPEENDAPTAPVLFDAIMRLR